MVVAITSIPTRTMQPDLEVIYLSCLASEETLQVSAYTQKES